MFPLLWLMNSKLLFMMVVPMVSVGDDNGDDCDAEMRLKTN